MVLEWETRTDSVVGISRIVIVTIARRIDIIYIVVATTTDTIVGRVSLFDLSPIFVSFCFFVKYVYSDLLTNTYSTGSFLPSFLGRNKSLYY